MTGPTSTRSPRAGSVGTAGRPRRYTPREVVTALGVALVFGGSILCLVFPGAFWGVMAAMA